MTDLVPTITLACRRFLVEGNTAISRNKRKSAGKVWNAYRHVEKLSFPVSAWYFAQYAVRGLLKYRNF